MKRTKEISQSCIFCEGELLPIYHLNNFEIVQCQNCLSSTVSSYPDESVLQSFYSGFKFQTDRKHLSRITTPAIKKWMQSLNSTKHARMLDIGGGAGFFAYAFEYFGLGNSTYIDLDTSACAFAQNELNLKNVTCGDVKELSKHSPNSYDFIYCRHVIEHLIHPLEMIEASITLLKPGGHIHLTIPKRT